MLSCVYPGRIYVTFNALETGTTRSVVQVVHSDDEGATWSTPVTASIASGRQSFMPWMAVDPATGTLSVVYYAFDAATGFATNTYLASSVDGGGSFTNYRISDVSHITASIPGYTGGRGYAGDYIGIAARDGEAFPIWADDRTGRWQLYHSPVRYYSITAGNNCAGSPDRTFVFNNPPAGSQISWSTTLGQYNPPTGTGTKFTTTAVAGPTTTGTVTATVRLACGSEFRVRAVGVQTNVACRSAAAPATYPNPVDNHLTLLAPNANESEALSSAKMFHVAQLYNREGAVVRTLKWQGERHEVDTSSLANGLYYLRIQVGNSTTRSTLVVQH